MGDRKIPADTTILYIRQYGNGPFKEPGMGLKFTKIALEDQELLRQYIKRKVTDGIIPVE